MACIGILPGPIGRVVGGAHPLFGLLHYPPNLSQFEDFVMGGNYDFSPLLAEAQVVMALTT